MSRDKLVQNIVWFSMILGLALVLVMYAYGGTFSRFMADDYCTTARAQLLGVGGSWNFYYFNWGGLYSKWLVLAVIGRLGVMFLAVLPTILLILLLLSLGFASYQIALLLKFKQPRLSALFLTLTLIFATLAGSPNPMQSLYWLAASIPYILPLPFAAVYVGLFVLTMRQSPNKVAPVYLVISFLITLFAGGLTEIYVVWQLVLLLGAFGSAVLFVPATHKRSALFVLGSGLLGAVLALIFVLIAPGNAIRQQDFQDPLPLPELFLESARYTGTFFLTRFIIHTPLLMLMIFMSGLFLTFRQQERGVNPFRLSYRAGWHYLTLALVFLVGLGLVFSAVLANVYGTSGAPPERHQTQHQFLLACTLLVLGYIVGIYLKNRLLSEPNVMITTIASLIFLGFVGVSVIQQISYLNTQYPQLMTFAQEWDSREAQIHEAVADGAREITTHQLSVEMTHMIGLPDILIDHPRYWVNECAAWLYQVESVVAYPDA